MTNQSFEAACVLGLDLGSMTTRASFFDIVDGQYRFVASGEADTTAGAPYFDVNIGAVNAIRQLEQVTDRRMVDSQGGLLMPAQTDGHGLDYFVLVYSVVPEMRIVTAGLLNEASLESANHLVSGMYGTVVDNIGLGDRRQLDEQVDGILKQQPDMIILTGGSDGGATRSVIKLAELIRTICQFAPNGETPQVLYSGNNRLVKKVETTLDKYCQVFSTDNIRPAMDTESLGPARMVIEDVVSTHARRKVLGFEQISGIASTAPIQSATGLSWLVQMVQAISNSSRPVLGVDVGSTFTSVAAARRQNSMNSTISIGMGRTLPALLSAGKLDEICQWLPPAITPAMVQDAVAQKALHPQTKATTNEQIAIEEAVLRVLLRLAMQQLHVKWHIANTTFEPILISGKPLAGISHPWKSLLLALDGLQPTGITTILQDSHSILPVVGAAGRMNPLIPVQVLDSGAVNHLATVICPVSRAPAGTPILRVTIMGDEGKEEQMEVRQGALVVLPIRFTQTVKVDIAGLHGTLVDPLSRSSFNSMKITGGLCGAVIDARGRPLALPKDPQKRWELIEKWQAIIA